VAVVCLYEKNILIVVHIFIKICTTIYLFTGTIITVVLD